MYTLKFGSQKVPVYCHMGNFGCGDGGWTLAMKINGAKVKRFAWSTEVMYTLNLKGYYQHGGFGQNTGRYSGNLNGILGFDCYPRSGTVCLFWARMQDWGRIGYSG